MGITSLRLGTEGKIECFDRSIVLLYGVMQPRSTSRQHGVISGVELRAGQLRALAVCSRSALKRTPHNDTAVVRSHRNDSGLTSALLPECCLNGRDGESCGNRN